MRTACRPSVPWLAAFVALAVGIPAPAQDTATPLRIIVFGAHPDDYHPDHRYTGILVQDAAFMVIVPNFCPDVPALRKNPVFLYSEDGFKKPNPFEPDVVVPIDPVIDRKVACVDALESQFYEWNPWLFGYLDTVPKEKQARLEWTKDRTARRAASLAERFRPKLVE